MKVSKQQPLGGQFINFWSLEVLVVVTTQPSVSHIIDEDHNNIGRPFFRCSCGNAKKQEGKDGIELFHEDFGKKASIKKTILNPKLNLQVR